MTFILLGKYGGLVPATFALVFISAMGDRQHTPRSAALLEMCIRDRSCSLHSFRRELLVEKRTDEPEIASGGTLQRPA